MSKAANIARHASGIKATPRTVPSKCDFPLLLPSILPTSFARFLIQLLRAAPAGVE
jgi:hypothetical protein